MTPTLKIVKIGGHVIDNDENLDSFLYSFAQLSHPKILVHGGGKKASKLEKQLGIQSTFIEGRRVTHSDSLEIITMVYGGLINKKIVAHLLQYKTHCIGISGVDANLITAAKRPLTSGVDFGFVGDPIAVNTDILSNFLQHDLTPIVAPITHNGKGQLLNTNADTVATVLATSMSSMYPVDLVFTFELPGILQDLNDPNSLLKEINLNTYAEMKEKGTVSKGMIPKLDNAFEALNCGVKSVKIVHYDAVSRLDESTFNTYTHVVAS